MENEKKGACLAQGLETQASDSTGFRNSLKQLIVDLHASKTAYGTISVDDPSTKCLFVASLMKWAHLANYRLIDHLEKITKGECDEVLTLNFAKFCNKANWQSERMKRDMKAYSDKPLKEYLELCNSYETAMDLYQMYETNVFELAENLKKVKSSFDHPELYENLMQQMKGRYADPDIAYEYEQMKDDYVDPTLKDYLKMQVKACVDFLKSGMLNDILSLSNEDIDEVDEVKLHKMLDPRCEVPANLKELWAKLKKFIKKKGDVMLVPRRDLIRIQVLKHFDELNADDFSALFRLDNLLMLIHQDMVKKNPELAKYLNSTMNEQPANNQQESIEELFHFIHPSLDDEEGWKIHNEVKRLVKRQSIQVICLYLKGMARERNILLPPMPSEAYAELIRMGMPQGEGFSEKHFRNCYMK